MKTLQKIVCATMGAFVVSALSMTQAEASYRPTITSKVSTKFAKDVQNTVALMRAWTKSQRGGFMAERLGLLFMQPNGASGHLPDDEHGWKKDGSHFIGADGMEYDAYSEIDSIKDLYQVSDNTERFGREVVFSKLSTEVTQLVLQNAKYHLDMMAKEQPERRDMYLAYLAKLCYLPNGKSPYAKEKTQIGPHKRPIKFYAIENKGCKFVDTEGVEHDYDEVHKKYVSLGGARWLILNVCAHHIGKKDILDLYPEEVKKLQRNYKKKMQEFGKKASAPTGDMDKTKTASKDRRVAYAKKLGVTYRSKLKTDKMPTQYRKDIQKAVSFLKSLKPELRWLFLSERLGMMFMPTSGGCGYQADFSLARGSRFIGADGMEYDAVAGLNTLTNDMWRDWENSIRIAKGVGNETLFAQFGDEVAELVLQSAKYQLDKIEELSPEARDAALARIARLEYQLNGNTSYAPLKWKAAYGGMIEEYKLDASPDDVYFTDSEGKEHRGADVWKYAPVGRWELLMVCTHHLGKDAILGLCPTEVKKLRENYEKRKKKHCAAAVKLKSWPQRAREAWLVERLDLTYMPDGSSPKDSRGWTTWGARYIGSDGKEYDWWQSSYYIGNREEWGVPGRLMADSEEEFWLDIHEEVAQLQKVYTEHAPAQAR